MATAAKLQRASDDRPWIIGLAVLVAIGIIAWIVQLAVGFDVLGVGQSISWGVYIATFFMLAGAGSGLLLLTAASDLGVLVDLAKERRSFLIASVACYIAAGFMILMDVGKPWRVLNMVFSPNFKSMFVWDFYFLALSVILALVYLYRSPMSKGFSGAMALAATAVVLVEGWILAVSAGTPLWHSSIIPVTFFVEGVLTASAMVLLKKGAESSAGNVLRRLMLTLLPIVLVLNLLEAVTMSYAGEAEAAAAMKLLVGGSLALAFWGQLVVGVILPFVLLLRAESNLRTIRVAAFLAIVGVLAAKLNLLVAGRAIPFMASPTSYSPTITELGGVIGVLGLATLLYVLGKRMIPFKTEV
jgi:dimethyl sulfoxide reductase membrane subunit